MFVMYDRFLGSFCVLMRKFCSSLLFVGFDAERDIGMK